jgi:hypothetical protein
MIHPSELRVFFFVTRNGTLAAHAADHIDCAPQIDRAHILARPAAIAGPGDVVGRYRS